MNYKLISCCAVLLLLCYVGDAQVYRAGFKGGAAWSNVIDNEFSSLPWSGMAGAGGLFITYNKKKISQELSASYIYGVLSSSAGSANKVTQSALTINYTCVYEMTGKKAGGQYALGGSINYLHINRDFEHFINKQRSYESALFPAVVMDVLFPLNNKLNKWSLSDRIQFPLFTWYSRSSADKADWQFSAPFGDFLYIGNAFALNRALNNRHRLSVTYNWNYYRIQSIQEVKQATHQCFLVYTVKL